MSELKSERQTVKGRCSGFFRNADKANFEFYKRAHDYISFINPVVAPQSFINSVQMLSSYRTSPSTFRAGQSVRYFSSALKCWVSATIQGFNPDGSMNLNEEPLEYQQTVVQAPQV